MRAGDPTIRRLLPAVLFFAPFLATWAAHPWIVRSSLPVCIFKAVTGRPCPFCGLTHAFACAMHGEWAAAAGHHPYWWIAALLLLILGSISLVEGLRGGRSPSILRRGWERLPWPAIVTIMLASMAIVLYGRSG
jgi:hypothetical protein